MKESRGRIVVGVDASPQSRRALSWAVAEAELWGATLDVVHAWLFPLALQEGRGPTSLHPELVERGSRAILEGAVASVGTTGIELSPMLVEGEPVPELARLAAGADLLVVGSRGHGGFAGRLIGSVGQRCLDSAPCPVVVVPHDAKPRTRTIVVGVDGSEPSCAALHWAVAEARRRRTRLEVVNAYRETEVMLPFGPATTSDHERREQNSSSLLDHMVAGAIGPARAPQIETISSPLGAAAALRDAAATAALLVVGSRGRGGLRGLGLGSVSLQCVHHAACPVVVVHGHEADEP
jgi:nucleotide-binding universal stress UspA family protein